MRTINSNLLNSIQAGAASLCRIFTITRIDATVKRFTDLDHDITVSGQLYLASNSVSISAITSTSNNGIQSADTAILFEDTAISEVDTVRGKYDGATFEVAIVNYEHPEYGKIVLFSGQFGSIEVTNKYFGNFEIRGLLNRADSRIGEFYQAECRADLGDSRCTKDITSFTKTGIVVTVINASKIVATLSEDVANGFFSFGVLTWTSGENSGLSMEVLNQLAVVGGDQINLALGMPYPVAVSDTFSIVAGCDHRKVTCLTKFDNILNFRGEPYVPGGDIVNDKPLTDTLG